MALGETLPSNRGYREELCSRHFLGDLRNLLWVLFQKDPMRDLTLPSRIQALKGFLFPPKHCRSDVMDTRDPRPALMELFDAAMRNTQLSPVRTAGTRCSSAVVEPLPRLPP
jgi:hypothetical protein